MPSSSSTDRHRRPRRGARLLLALVLIGLLPLRTGQAVSKRSEDCKACLRRLQAEVAAGEKYLASACKPVIDLILKIDRDHEAYKLGWSKLVKHRYAEARRIYVENLKPFRDMQRQHAEILTSAARDGALLPADVAAQVHSDKGDPKKKSISMFMARCIRLPWTNM